MILDYFDIFKFFKYAKFFYSISSIIPPPTNISPSYITKDCPLVIALCASSNTTLAVLSDSLVTVARDGFAAYLTFAYTLNSSTSAKSNGIVFTSFITSSF